MREFLNRLKPAVRRRTHLLSAAFLWTGIGCILMVRGVFWLAESGGVYYGIPAAGLGCLKSLLVLDKSAQKSIDRILRLSDGSCLGAVYSVKTWCVVMIMMILGYAIRHSTLPLYCAGVLYVLIGSALIFSSRLGWRAWLLASK